MSEADEARAARRYLAIQLVRMGGIACFLAGIAILAGTLAAPRIAAMVLVVLGAFATFLAPVLLARRWSSRRQP